MEASIIWLAMSKSNAVTTSQAMSLSNGLLLALNQSNFVTTTSVLLGLTSISGAGEYLLAVQSPAPPDDDGL
jgi:hypothetical protein